MKAMKLAFHGKVDSLVMLAGDGDFKDMVSFFSETLNKNVWIIGYK
jgi:uncharacterized LabA/DUF88 family protein